MCVSMCECVQPDPPQAYNYDITRTISVRIAIQIVGAPVLIGIIGPFYRVGDRISVSVAVGEIRLAVAVSVEGAVVTAAGARRDFLWRCAPGLRVARIASVPFYARNRLPRRPGLGVRRDGHNEPVALGSTTVRMLRKHLGASVRALGPRGGICTRVRNFHEKNACQWAHLLDRFWLGCTRPILH